MDINLTREQHLQMAAHAVHEDVLRIMKASGMSTLDYARVIGTVLANLEPHSIEPDHNTNSYHWMADQYFAELVKRALPKYESLYDSLVRRGATSADEEFDVGSDVYIYALHDDVQPKEKSRPGEYIKTLVLRTQRNQYVIVLRGNRPQKACEVHIREFWPDILAVLDGDDSFPDTDDIVDAADRTDMTIKDLATFGHCLKHVSDDVEGNHSIERPSLRSFLSGSMIAGDKDAGPALRYGDGRDRGFILSARTAGFDGDSLVVEDALSANFEIVSFVMSTMGFAVETVEYADNEDKEA
jgi:hypothetical protein